MQSKSELENLINSLKIGDTVYPAYDGKPMRCTPCKITDIEKDVVTVEGTFWGHKEKEIGYFSITKDDDDYDLSTYIEGDDTLIEEGDYYSLYSKEYMYRVITQCIELRGGTLSDTESEYFQYLGLTP